MSYNFILLHAKYLQTRTNEVLQLYKLSSAGFQTTLRFKMCVFFRFPAFSAVDIQFLMSCLETIGLFCERRGKFFYCVDLCVFSSCRTHGHVVLPTRVNYIHYGLNCYGLYKGKLLAFWSQIHRNGGQVLEPTLEHRNHSIERGLTKNEIYL